MGGLVDVLRRRRERQALSAQRAKGCPVVPILGTPARTQASGKRRRVRRRRSAVVGPGGSGRSGLLRRQTIPEGRAGKWLRSNADSARAPPGEPLSGVRRDRSRAPQCMLKSADLAVAVHAAAGCSGATPASAHDLSAACLVSVLSGYRPAVPRLLKGASPGRRRQRLLLLYAGKSAATLHRQSRGSGRCTGIRAVRTSVLGASGRSATA